MKVNLNADNFPEVLRNRTTLAPANRDLMNAVYEVVKACSPKGWMYKPDTKPEDIAEFASQIRSRWDFLVDNLKVGRPKFTVTSRVKQDPFWLTVEGIVMNNGLFNACSPFLIEARKAAADMYKISGEAPHSTQRRLSELMDSLGVRAYRGPSWMLFKTHVAIDDFNAVKKRFGIE